MNCLALLVTAALCVAVANGALLEKAKNFILGLDDQLDSNNSTEDISRDLSAIKESLKNMFHIHSGPRPAAVRGISASLDTSNANTQNAIVQQINGLRRSEGADNMQRLAWNAKVAAAAQSWANQCTFTHPVGSQQQQTTYLTTTSPDFSLGQNIAMGTGTMTWDQAIKMWYDEKTKSQFVFGSGSANNQVVGHYTALVWASTYDIGCGYTLCPGAKNYFVCNFGPAGNMSPNENSPYEKGTPCGKCPGAACDNGLCTNPCTVSNAYSNCDSLFAKASDCGASAYAGLKALQPKCQATCTCKPKGLLY